MDIIMTQKSLASMAVFSQMHNAKKNIYDIIRSFIILYLSKIRKYQFPISEIVHDINEYYNFNLPSAVIQTAIKGLIGIDRKDSIYIVDYELFPCCGDMNIEKVVKDNEEIFNNLVVFIEEKTTQKMTDDYREQLFKNFSSFLLNNNILTKDTEFISAFIISNADNNVLQEKLNEIKEGIIIYSGITNDADISKLGYWGNTLNIFLDTEILFHIVGYNGDYYLQQATDFLQLINEINRKRKYIHLKYFREVEKEIDSFFYAAEQIVVNGKLIDDRVAMIKITDGCKTASDVIEKKTKFQILLQKYNIKVDTNTEYYHEKNHKYNIENKDFEVSPVLNYINILRKGNNSGRLTEIEYILLTGKNTIIQQAWDSRIKGNGEIPRASTLDYMTERFWFILNKGFGVKVNLKSFEVIRKAAIAMASVISHGIREKYEDVCKKFTDGELSSEQVANIILNLRKENKLPEEINNTNIDIILNLLDENEIERIQNETIIKEKKLYEAEVINKEQSKRIENAEKLICNQSKKIEELENEIKKHKDKETQKEERKQKILYIIKRILLTILIISFSIFIIYIIFKFILPYITIKVWEVLSKIATVITIIGITPLIIIRKIWKINRKVK